MGKRLDYIDICKGIGIILVVFHHSEISLHCNFAYDYIWKSFFMPLFFLMSGIFLNPAEKLSVFLKKKTFGILIPFLFFYLLPEFILPLLKSLYSGNAYDCCRIFRIIYTDEAVNQPVWFLLCLYVADIIFYLTFWIENKLRIKQLQLFINLMLSFGGYVLAQEKINIPLFVDTAMVVSLFVNIGFLIKERLIKIEETIYQASIANKFMILFVLTLILLVSSGGVSYHFNRYDSDFPCLIISGVCGTLGTLNISMLVKNCRFLSYIGSNSLIILVVHQLVINYVSSLVKPLECCQLILLFIIAMLMSLLLIPICKRVMPFWVGYKKK